MIDRTWRPVQGKVNKLVASHPVRDLSQLDALLSG
jgi:hypothetical protein